MATAYADSDLGQWLVPNADERLAVLRRWVALYTNTAFAYKLVEQTSDEVAAAVWLPGPREVLPQWWLRLAKAADRHQDRFAALHWALGAVELPPESHVELVHAGVDQARQGQGLGSALLNHRLRGLDHRHHSAYAVATCPQTQAWLTAQGFNDHGPPVKPAGSRLRLQPMWRNSATSRHRREET